MFKPLVRVAVVVCALDAVAAFAQPYEHLKCYKFRDVQTFHSAEADIDTIEAAFGLQNCQIKRKAKQFCIPASKSVTVITDGIDSPFPAQDLAFNQICYRIRCPSVTIPDQQLSDQFGTRTGSNFKASLLCVPAVIGLPPTTTTTSTTTTSTTTTTLATTFSLRAGDTGLEQALNVAVDSNGNTIAVGTYSSATDFGNGALTVVDGNELFVVKLDPDGNPLWSLGFAATGSHTLPDVAVDSADRILVTGSFTTSIDFGGGALPNAGGNDVFLAKLDTDGSHLWSASYGGASDDFSRSVAVDGSNAVVITGTFASASIDFGGGPLSAGGTTDGFVAKLDASGAHVWSQAFGAALSAPQLFGATTDTAGNVLLTGALFGGVDFGGGAVTSAGGSDVLAVKLSSAGAHLWSAAYGDATNQFGFSVATDAADSVYLTGTVAGTIDFGGGGLTSAGLNDVYLAKIDSGGAHLWSQIYGDAATQSSYGLAVDAAGNVHLSGSFEGAVDFGGGPLTSGGSSDIFIMKRSPSGTHISSQGFGDSALQGGGGLDTDTAGHRYLVGRLEGTVDFGDGPLTDAGGGDAYIAKLAP
jgi:hypothetical protein